MNFIQLSFIGFLIAGMLVFYICPAKCRWVILLALSLIFYGMAGVNYFPFIFVTSFTVWLTGRWLGRIYERQAAKIAGADMSREEKNAVKEQDKGRCKRIMMFCLVLNVTILCVTKFTKFFVGPINELLMYLGGEGNFSAASVMIPLGISYYTFSAVSYLMDVYWRRVDYEKNYFRFLLYLIYFPHILQGPIERYARLGHRLKQELRFDWDRILGGMQLMLWGYFKKLVIADRVNLFITGVYANPAEAPGLLSLLAVCFDAVYIYTDFSGCMDIARGISQIFGVELDKNFEQPFSSTGTAEFWRRWHITLGAWFKDYIYMPIVLSPKMIKFLRNIKKKFGERCSKTIKIIVPLMAVWLLTGLWHGTGLPYVVWGVYWFTLIMTAQVFEPEIQKLTAFLRIHTEAESFKVFQKVRTAGVFAIGRLITRPGSLSTSREILKGMISTFNPWVFLDETIYSFGLDRFDFAVAVLSVILLGYIGHLQNQGSVREMLNKQNLLFRWGIYLALIFGIIIFGIYGPGFDSAAFVYMDF